MIASYQCKAAVGCRSNLVGVFVPCKVCGNMNS